MPQSEFHGIDSQCTYTVDRQPRTIKDAPVPEHSFRDPIEHLFVYPPNQTAGQEDQEQVAQAVSLSPYCFHYGFPFSFFAEKMQIARPVPQHSCGLLSLILKKITAEGIPFCGD